MPLENLVPNDGDGVLERIWPTERYHRLYAVYAPEVYSQNFMKTDNGVYKRRNGHLSHLAVHLYLNKFGKPEGTADIYVEKSKWVMPLDHYNRHLSSFWFKWEAQPRPEEMQILREIFRVTSTLQPNVKRRLMNDTDPTASSQTQPFILNLNALLVLAGFCLVFTRYCTLVSVYLFQRKATNVNLLCYKVFILVFRKLNVAVCCNTGIRVSNSESKSCF